jgi:hypothetical protein
MDLFEFIPPDDLTEQIARLSQPAKTPSFALATSQFKKFANDDWTSRRGIRKLIHPDNARVVVPHLPSPGERTHCALRGDFVLCDLIPAIIDQKGKCPDLFIATLGMSEANADTLVSLHARGRVGKISLVCSHYFARVDKTTVFQGVTARLKGIADIMVSRSHAKIILIPTEKGDSFVIEGSANLRTSDNAEQIVIFNDSDLDRFHREWLSSLLRYG